MAFRVATTVAGLIRDGRLFYPLGWYRIPSLGRMPLVIVLCDQRGAVQMALDMGAANLVRTDDPAFEPRGSNDWRHVALLFLEPPDVQANWIQAPALPPVYSRRWSTGLAVSGYQTHDADDFGLVVDMARLVAEGFRTAVLENPPLQPVLYDPALVAGVDPDRIYVLAVGPSASTLAFQLLASATRWDGSGAPLFTGAAVLGGTIGGQPFANVSGLSFFPAAAIWEAWPPSFPTPGLRLLSIQADPAASSPAWVDQMGTESDDRSTGFFQADDSLVELADAGFLVPGNGDDLVRVEYTNGASVHEWAAWAYPGGLWVSDPVSSPPYDVSTGAPILAAYLENHTWNVPTGYGAGYGAVNVPVKVAIWRSLDGLPQGVWPSAAIPQSNSSYVARWEGLIEIIDWLVFG